MQTPSFLWVTDPWSTLYHTKDTTLRLMLEAINMGIPTFWTASDFLFSGTSHGEVMAVEVKNKSDLTDLETLERRPYPLSRFQQIHDRIDPPVDEHYCKLIDQLLDSGASEQQILNPPSLLKYLSEKIPPDELMQFAPKLFVLQHESELNTVINLFKNDAEIVSKPLHLAQSIGVNKHPTPKSFEEWKSLAVNLTHGFTQPILFEEYLSEIQNGETRLWFAGEVLVGSMRKYPKKGDFRVLIDEGSRVSAHTLTPEEEHIAKAIGSTLKKQGVLMAAVDLIGNKICDYNITSPGLLMQLEEVCGGTNLARIVLNQALQYRAPQVHE
jgi:glutathione synthase